MALNVLYGILLLCGQTAARSDGFCTEIEGNGLAFLYNFTRPARAYRGQTMARAAHAFSWPDVMSLLVANHLSKSYGDLNVFENVDLRIELGDRIGLVGANGAGKTSLLKALGRLDPNIGGELFITQNTRIGYLPQDPPSSGKCTLYDDLTEVFAELLAQGEALQRMEARMTDGTQSDAALAALLTQYGAQQEAFERAGGYAIDQRVKFVLTGLGFAESFWHEPLAHLSGGQRTRAYLGRLLLAEPDLLLLDEPTNHLDVRAVEWLEGVLTGWKGALVIVSHDRYFLDTVVRRIWDLSHGRVETYRGNYSHYRQQRAERYMLWRKEYDRQQKFIRETQEFIRRYKAGQRTKEAQGRETRLKRFLETEALSSPPTEQHIRLPLHTDTRSGDLVLRTRKLVAGYRGTPSAAGSGHARFDHLLGRARINSQPPALPRISPSDTIVLEVPDLDIQRGQVIALIGPNGAGKTTLVRTILGELEPLAGRVDLGAAVEVGYLAQRHVGAGFGMMKGQQTVLDTLLDVKRLPTERARTYLGQFLFKGDDVYQTIDSLSGGQRSRIALARLTLQGANFLLLDEPTNHLDLDSQEILQDALRQFNGTILLVTHDRALVDALATQLWLLEPGGAGKPATLELFKGTWRQWLSARGHAEQESAASASQTMPNACHEEWARQRAARRQRQQAARQEQAVVETEERIARLESKLAALEQAMAQASARQDLGQVYKLQEQHRAVSQRLESLIEEWAALARLV